MGVTQPSLRDGISFYRKPTLESVGYSRVPLREKTANRLCCRRGGEPKMFNAWRLDGATGRAAFNAWQAVPVPVSCWAIEGRGPQDSE